MRFLHISDLHIGKRVNEFSMLDDQAYILNEILRIAKEQEVDGILAAGDIYDKTVPGAEAVQLLDDFLTRAALAGLPVYLVSGNHDSAQRLAFGAKLLGRPEDENRMQPGIGGERAGIYISPVYDGTIVPVQRRDAHGSVAIYLIPFIKPAEVRRFFPECKIETYQDAFAAVLNNLEMNPNERNICVAHQLITGAVRSESEEVSIGGMDNVDVTLLRAFDYVALGHIHRPQQMAEAVRYCGTPLKYSFSEAEDEKSVTLVELKEKGNLTIETIPLKPLHDMRRIRGTYEEVTLKKNYERTDTADYVSITLTDEDDIPNALGKLRAIYPNVMKLEYDNRRTQESAALEPSAAEQKSPMEFFEEFYRLQNNQELAEQQKLFLRQMMEEVWDL